MEMLDYEIWAWWSCISFIPGKIQVTHPVHFKVGHVHIVRPELPAHIKTIICDHEPSANLIEYLVECIK